MTYSLRPVPPAAIVTTDLASLTSAQQDSIVEGTLVTTSTTGERWQYTGTGSKTTSASYVLISDVTPDWSIITNKPSTFPPDPHAITGHSASPNSITYADSTGTLNSLSLGSTGTVLTSLGTSSAPGFDTVPNLIPNGSITYAKIQAVTAADRVLGAATLAGVITEITCTSQARALLDDATAADMRTTLALGTAATSSSSDFALATHGHTTTDISGLGGAALLNVGTGAGTVAAGDDARLSDARTPTSHTHGNISNTGTIGSTSNLPLKTGTGGLVETGLFGTGANEFCEGNDARLSDARTPTSHTHGNISNTGTIGSTSNLPLKTGTGGVVETGLFGSGANEFCEGNDARLSDARTPTSHTHGNLTNDGKLGSTSGLPVVTTTDGAVTTLALGTAGQALVVNSGANGLEFATSGGVASGSVDNAILRADGTGGSTSQSSDIVIDDATTSTQNNVAIRNIHDGQTNSALVLTPKGTGALIAGPKPDGTSTGGNARGANAVDIQLKRFAGTNVASGTASVAVGESNTASGTNSCAIGVENTASSSYALALGVGNTAQTGNQSSVLGGRANIASGLGSVVCGGGASNVGNQASGDYGITLAGRRALADREGMLAQANGAFSALGDAQRARFVMRNKTTTNSAVELFLNGSSTRLTIPSGKIFAFTINISGVKSDGSAVAHYLRQYCLKNVAGTTSEVYAPVTLGTDNAAGTSIALSANDTNDALKVEVTGVLDETWRWVAAVDAVEIAYGA